MKQIGLHKKQRLAISRMERALKALDEAGISLCGMDDQLLWATKEACDRNLGGDYIGVANAVLEEDEESGAFLDAPYLDSGGW